VAMILASVTPDRGTMGRLVAVARTIGVNAGNADDD
jgi:hypothetical protein